jgi:5-methyltetrahydropteroyltriglutamate--homocysteine methyltransferase
MESRVMPRCTEKIERGPHIPLERLIVSTDCGFGREGMSRRIAFYKMVSIVRGANIVRRELGLPEAECRAADARFALAEDV